MSERYLERLARGDHGQKSERKTANRLGGRLQPGSGCSPNNKGDIKLDQFLVENKSTIHESLGVKLEWLRKISDEAASLTKEPALAIQFVDSSGRSSMGGRWVVIPERVFKELTE